MKNWPRNLSLITVAASIVLCAAPLARAQTITASALYIDGHPIVGRLIAITNDEVQLAADATRPMLSFDELMSITFEATPQAKKGDVTVFLADGGRLYAELLDSVEDAIVVRTLWGASITLPYETLAGVKLAHADGFAASAQLFFDALDKPLPGNDVLITRSNDKAQVMRGRLSSLGPRDGSFVFSERERLFKLDKIFGIVFAGTGPPSKNSGQRIDLADGSSIIGQVNRLDKRQLIIDTNVAGKLSQPFQLSLPIDLVKQIKFFSRRITYLSDISSLAETIEGRIHRPWPIRRDRTVAMHPLRLGGIEYEKGLGVHSRTRVSFDVNKSYDLFVSIIGLDDSVAPRGNVVFQVLGDEKILFDSGLVHGTDQPILVSVDISSVNVLTLLVDYGDELDLADHADWAGARLIKNPSQSETSTNTQ